MAFGASTINDFAGSISDLLGGSATAAGLRLKSHGDLAEADNYDLAATLAKQNEEFTKQSTAIKDVQAQRQIYLGLGDTSASVAGSGFGEGGSALDIMRQGAQQGALTKQVIGQQGLITEAGYDEQQKAYKNMAEAARYAAAQEDEMASTASRNGWITGGIKAAAGIASLFI